MLAETIRSIPSQLGRLRQAVSPTGRILSAYLDTSLMRADKSAYLLAFRDGCKQIRAALNAGELGPFELAVKQTERFLDREVEPGPPGLALFASGSDDYFFAMPLPGPPADEVDWGERPLLAPLHELLDHCERIAVVLFDKERARLFSIFLGEIEECRTIHDDVPAKQATGGWFALAQARYARHHEYHVLQHAKHAIRELTAMRRERPFDHLLIGGPDEAVATLQHHLPRPLRARLSGRLDAELFAADADVLQAALQAADELRRREDRMAIEELLDAATAPHVALGLRPVLQALFDRRVHRLFVADSFDGEAGECPGCGRLVPGPAHCPSCGVRTRLLGDLRERVVELATIQGARVEMVANEAAALLTTHGGIGAWTRY